MATTAKKTTTAKPAAKKTATAKPVAKKTATAKPVAKKTTAAKPAAKKTEITVNGNKKVDTLRMEFNKIFPYLSICICYPAAKTDFDRLGICYEVQRWHTIGDVRRVDYKGDVSISGNKKIKTLQKEFEDKLGLFVKVCYRETQDCRYPVSASQEEYTLAAFNALCEKRGCIKDAWK